MNPALAKPLLFAGVADALLGVGFLVWAASGDAPQAMWLVGGLLVAAGLGLVFFALRLRASAELGGKR
ncbi:MAG: hypothetical protein L6Q99_14450 [Planctomycetes bacterium]|nr:hypothetical protein [Planctomycetota bacterium]